MKERNNKHSLNRVSVFLVSRPTTLNILRTTKMIIYFHIKFAVETIFKKQQCYRKVSKVAGCKHYLR